jgi:hypothetical protein
MKIIVDSREQAPFTFANERYAGTIVKPGTLDTGDYSLVGQAGRQRWHWKATCDHAPVSTLAAGAYFFFPTPFPAHACPAQATEGSRSDETAFHELRAMDAPNAAQNRSKGGTA